MQRSGTSRFSLLVPVRENWFYQPGILWETRDLCNELGEKLALDHRQGRGKEFHHEETKSTKQQSRNQRKEERENGTNENKGIDESSNIVLKKKKFTTKKRRARRKRERPNKSSYSSLRALRFFVVNFLEIYSSSSVPFFSFVPFSLFFPLVARNFTGNALPIRPDSATVPPAIDPEFP